jgi:hypothetical protein
MDEGKILLVNLSRGRTGDLNSKLLGMIFVMKFEAAAMSRADVPEDYRRDFCLYVDEFQNFSTDSFADILSQARKYHLNLIVANQFTTQLSEEIRDAVFGNVGSVIAFRVGTTDAEFLSKQFAPVFDLDDLQFLPNYNTAVRMMIGGVPVQPFSMATLPPLGNPNPQLADALKQLSAAKYGKPKATVESEIFKRLETKTPAKPASPFGGLPPAGGAGYRPPSSAFGSSPLPPPGGNPFGQRPLAPPTPAPSLTASNPLSGLPKPSSTGSSFLDEWLSKRKDNIVAPTASAPTWPKSNSPAMPTPSVTNNPKPAPLKTPAQPKLEAAVAPQQTATDGEFKIDRDIDPAKHQSQVVHIDKDGNLSFGD